MQYDMMMVTNKTGGINSLKIIYAVKFINWQIYSYKLHFTVYVWRIWIIKAKIYLHFTIDLI